MAVGVATPESAAVELRAGEALAGELPAGGVGEYRIRLTDGQYLRLALERRQDGLEVVLHGPFGEALGESGATVRWGVRALAVVAPATGVYRLRVAVTPPSAAPVAYRLRVEALRAAEPLDAQRVAAQRAFSEALRARDLDTAAANDLALSQLERSLALATESGDARAAVDALIEIGWTLILKRDLAGATATLERALALAQDLDYAFGQANALNNLGLAYGPRGETAEALAAYQKALALWGELDDTREMGVTSYNLAYLYYNNFSDNTLALAHYERALALVQSAGDAATAAMTLNGIGLIHRRTGEIERAMAFFSEGLELSRKAGDVRAEGNLVASLGGALQMRGELQAALDLYVEALRSFRAAGDKDLEASALQSLGGVYSDLGDFDRALETYEQALRLLRQTASPEWQALCLTSIGWSHYVLGDPHRALQHYEEALVLARSIPSKRVEGQALHNSGVARAALGEVSEAIALLESALEVRRAAVRKAEIAMTLVELGTVLGRNGRTAAARERLDEALRLAGEIGHPLIEAVALLRRCEVDRAEERWVEALAGAERALAILESIRSGVQGRQLRTSFFAFKHSYFETYIELLMDLHERDPEQGHAARALRACEQSRARGLLELLAEGRLRVQQGIAADLKEREATLDRRLSWAQRELTEGLSSGRLAKERELELRAELTGIDAERQELEREIQRRYPAYAEIAYPRPLDLAGVQRQLDGRTALFEYCLGERRSFLFVVTQEGLATHELPAAHEIAGNVHDLRIALAMPSQRLFGQYVLRARVLFQSLLAPASDVLAGKSILLIAPDEALHLLPFEVLLTEVPTSMSAARLPYLLTTHALAYVPSAGVLASLRQARARAGGPGGIRFIGFADPAFASAGPPGQAGPWQPLPQSRREVTEIAAIYGPQVAALYLGEQAVEENVKDNALLATARRVHFATHGFVNEDQPQLSGLALARSDTSEEDGLLQVYEIFNLSLDADLVVLSACDTGLGKQVSGEGLLGVTRAFLYAGARSLLVSLWQVRDAPTPELMTRFYRQTEEGLDEIDALRQAKMAMIAGRRFAHPSYWAPFVLIGEPSGRGGPVTVGRAIRLSAGENEFSSQ